MTRRNSLIQSGLEQSSHPSPCGKVSRRLRTHRVEEVSCQRCLRVQRCHRSTLVPGGVSGGVGHKCQLATATLCRCRASTHYQDTTWQDGTLPVLVGLASKRPSSSWRSPSRSGRRASRPGRRRWRRRGCAGGRSRGRRLPSSSAWCRWWLPPAPGPKCATPWGWPCSAVRRQGLAKTAVRVPPPPKQPPNGFCPIYFLEAARTRPSTALAVSTTCSAVKPSSRITTSPGAEAPKRSTPMIAPASPT